MKAIHCWLARTMLPGEARALQIAQHYPNDGVNGRIVQYDTGRLQFTSSFIQIFGLFETGLQWNLKTEFKRTSTGLL